MTVPDSSDAARPPNGLSRRGQIAVVAFVVGLASVALVVRTISGAGSITPARCAPALAQAATLRSAAVGDMSSFLPATASQDLSDLAFSDAAGANVRLGSFSGRALLVNFWATWCVPCRAEMPALDRLAASKAGNDFQVVAINLDTDAGVAQQAAFLRDVGVTHLALYDDPKLALTSALRTRGLVFGLPTTLLVEAHGCRLGTLAGGAAWDSKDAQALVDATLAAAAPAPAHAS